MNVAVPPRAASCLSAIALAIALGLLAAPASVAAANLDLTATDVVVGQAIQATAELSDSPAATGTIEFEVFAPGDTDCETPLSPGPGSATVAGEGTYPSGAIVTAAAGTYRWTAVYRDESLAELATEACVPASTVSQATPALSGAATAAATVGQAITNTVTLSAGFAPTGTLTFRAFGPDDPTCAGPPAFERVETVSGNVPYAPGVEFKPPPGLYLWMVAYSGDANNASSELPCGSESQASLVSKATPALTGIATSAATVGQAITNTVTLSAGFAPTGTLTFRAFGPDDPTCAGPPAFERVETVSGNVPYAPEIEFKPPPGLYLWMVTYSGDANNASSELPCGSEGQRSAVGTLPVTLTASATGATVGGSMSAVATLANGAVPGGQLTFKAFPPGDPTCTGAAAFSATVPVAGNRTYGSGPFQPTRVGSYRWTVEYSGDSNHGATGAGCGTAASTVAKAAPSLTGSVGPRLRVGARFRDTAVLAGGFAPTGTVTFRIFAPGDRSCAKPAYVNTVRVAGNGTVRSDPFIANRPGTYRFVATYSGDAANQAATEPCGSSAQLARVQKRKPRLLPRARLFDSQISIRALLAGGASPSGVIRFRLFGPGDRRCARPPAFSGSLRVRSNGRFALAEYIATRPGVYRLALGYSGDARQHARPDRVQTCPVDRGPRLKLERPGLPTHSSDAQSRIRRMRSSPRMRSRFVGRALLAAFACGLALALSANAAVAGPSTSDRPQAGKFVGQNSFGGPAKLTFQRTSGIGLHVGRYTIKGTLKCSDDEQIPFEFSGLVTARTAARVAKNGSFKLTLAGLRLNGRFVSARRVTGTLTVTTLACAKSGAFSATQTR